MLFFSSKGRMTVPIYGSFYRVYILSLDVRQAFPVDGIRYNNVLFIPFVIC